MTHVIALTGGIGSGKSTASDVFSKLGVPVIDADVIARQLTMPHQAGYDPIIAHFGNTVVKPNGEIDRAQLREIVFTNRNAKNALEKILHPLIYAEIVKQIKAITTPYCLVVIPLLAENFAEYKPIIHHVIVMDTPIDKQRALALAREKVDPHHIDLIMKQQSSYLNRMRIANTRLKNDGNIDELKRQITALHQEFLKLQ